jgi:hypothetical protein
MDMQTTQPPPPSDQEALEQFEEMIKTVGEWQARLTNLQRLTLNLQPSTES